MPKLKPTPSDGLIDEQDAVTTMFAPLFRAYNFYWGDQRYDLIVAAVDQLDTTLTKNRVYASDSFDEKPKIPLALAKRLQYQIHSCIGYVLN